MPTRNPRARVSLVGAGPGDPGLLTLRAAQILAAPTFCSTTRWSASRSSRGSRPRASASSSENAAAVTRWPQAGDRSADVREATRRKTRVRLKGGDPFVFGRGAEEAIALRAAGIPIRDRPGHQFGTGRTGVRGHSAHASRA